MSLQSLLKNGEIWRGAQIQRKAVLFHSLGAADRNDLSPMLDFVRGTVANNIILL
jgi:hypothetical protein